MWNNDSSLTDKIKKLNSFFNKIKSDCNNNPFNELILEEDLNSIELHESIIWIMEEMPGPLARIYVIYSRIQNDDSYFEKFNLIESFFLELAFLNISILLWVIRQDDIFYKKNLKTIKSSMKNPDAIWFWDLINLWLTLSKTIRVQITSNKEYLFNLFKIKDISFIEGITNKLIYSNIQKISNIRNKIKWHSWKIAMNEYKELLKESEWILFEQIELISYFKQIELISWSNFNENNWLYTWNIVFYKGFVFPYLRTNYTLSKILSKDRIYFIKKWWNYPIQISDFIKFDNSNDEEHHVSYFYNRVESDKIRYVTYESSVWDKYYGKKEIYEELIN